MKLNEQLGQTITRTVIVNLSDDAEAKDAGEARQGSLKIIFPASLTVNDLLENLCGASSPRVKWQSNQRRKANNKRDWSYTVKPVGRSLDPQAAREALIASMTLEERQALIARLQADLDEKIELREARRNAKVPEDDEVPKVPEADEIPDELPGDLA